MRRRLGITRIIHPDRTRLRKADGDQALTYVILPLNQRVNAQHPPEGEGPTSLPDW